MDLAELNILSTLPFPTYICFAVLLAATVFKNRMEPHEKLILVILLMNVSADVTADIMDNIYTKTGIVYNILTPMEKVLTMGIYVLNTKTTRSRWIYAVIAVITLIISTIGFLAYKSVMDLHVITIIASSIFVAAASYYQLRELAMDRASFSAVMVGFSLANLIYYTVMISSISSLPLAIEISNDFAKIIGTVNLIGYAMWSLIIFTGIIWKKNSSSSFSSS